MHACLTPEKVASFARQHGLSLVALFGSAARGKDHPRDVDLALAPGPAGSSYMEVARDVARHFQSCQLDLAWLPSASSRLWGEAARDGRPLFEARAGLFHEFQLEALRREWDGRIWTWRSRGFIRRTLEGRWDLNEELVTQELAAVAQYLARLESVLAHPLERFSSDFTLHHTAERLLELMVECAAKANSEIGQAVAKTPATDYYSSFFALVSAGWLTSELAQGLAQLASLRNVLVHRYQQVDLAQLHRELVAGLPLWKLYLSALEAHLD